MDRFTLQYPVPRNRNDKGGIDPAQPAAIFDSRNGLIVRVQPFNDTIEDWKQLHNWLNDIAKEGGAK